MKNILILALLSFTLSCATQNQALIPSDSNLVLNRIEDQEEHAIVIYDPGFTSWYTGKWSPGKDRSYEFYKSMNDRYVQAWNYKATSSANSSFFGSPIQYDSSENYGIEVARTLYYYFQYVENELGIRVLDSIRPTGI